MQELCLVCEGSGRLREEGPCPYCQGSGRLSVPDQAPRTVLLATASCRVPLRKVTLEKSLSVERHYVPTP